MMTVVFSNRAKKGSTIARNKSATGQKANAMVSALGGLGLFVALVLFAFAANHAVRPTVLLMLWPTSIAGIADPSDLSDKFIVALFEFGGNFVLYETIGALAGMCFHPRAAKSRE
jgi:hypothetical protein